MSIDLKALVLAGGRSRRFGSDKAAVVVAEQAQLDFLVSVLAKVVSDVRVSIRSDQSGDSLRAAYSQVLDQQTELGPAGGLLAAHKLEPESAWLVVACDMPSITANLLRELIHRREPHRGATAFVGSDGKPEPLCAIYEPATLKILQASVASDGHGVMGPRQLLLDADTALIQPVAGSTESFNTPDELAGIRQRRV
ncbi:MAG: NTP transferase domain-containing protein [Chromatiales bacterium]|nr:NTP transferase domain-containing protein [Chromatiales bacterium]